MRRIRPTVALAPYGEGISTMIRMPFGKYRDAPITELPDAYLEWLWSLDDLWEPLRSAVEAEWRARFGVASDEPEAWSSEALAAAEELVSAGYRHLAQQYHPDHGGAHGRMVLANIAVEALRRHLRKVKSARESVNA